jgi:hypothetical protein
MTSEIQAKLDAKGVKGYTLDVVPTADTSLEGKVVGSCECGTKKIVYRRKSTGHRRRPGAIFGS